VFHPTKTKYYLECSHSWLRQSTRPLLNTIVSLTKRELMTYDEYKIERNFFSHKLKT